MARVPALPLVVGALSNTLSTYAQLLMPASPSGVEWLAASAPVHSGEAAQSWGRGRQEDGICRDACAVNLHMRNGRKDKMPITLSTQHHQRTDTYTAGAAPTVNGRLNLQHGHSQHDPAAHRSGSLQVVHEQQAQLGHHIHQSILVAAAARHKEQQQARFNN